MDQAALANALAFADWGFGVFSVWGITEDGVCRCPKGQACTSPGKHPIPIDGLKSATNDPERVRTMLAAQGSQGQYGVVPAEHVIVLDVDGPGWKEKLSSLGLPPTFGVLTANGAHLYYFWPESYGPQPTRLYDWVVRSQEHPGYVIGPGSTHASGVPYRIARQNGHDIHEMLASIAVFPQEATARDAPVITVGQGLRQPESIPEGSRHDYLRDRARTLRGGGLTGDALLMAMQSINARLPSPKSDEELRRAIGDVETKFGEDPVRGISPEVGVEVPALDPADIISSETATPSATATDWLVTDLIRPGTIGLIAAREGLGKSVMRLELTMRLAAGHGSLFDHYPIRQAATVLVFDAENGDDEEYRREDEMGDALGIPRTKLAAHFRAGEAISTSIDLNEPQWQEYIEEVVTTYRPDLVVFDTIGTMGGGSDWGKEMLSIIRFLRRLVRRREDGWTVAVLLVHHFGKGARDTKGKRVTSDISDVYGQWGKFATWLALVTPVDDSDAKVRWVTKKRTSRVDLILEQKDGTWTTVVATLPAPTTVVTKRQHEVLGSLLHAKDGWRKVEGSPDSIGAWLETQGIKVSRRTLFNDMAALEAKGWATKDAEGRWSITDAGVTDNQFVRLVLMEGGSSPDEGK